MTAVLHGRVPIGPETGAYETCVAVLEQKCRDVGLSTQRLYFAPNKPVLLATRVGTNPHLPAILLNGHYDVVPTMEHQWSVDPFAGTVANGMWGLVCWFSLSKQYVPCSIWRLPLNTNKSSFTSYQWMSIVVLRVCLFCCYHIRPCLGPRDSRYEECAGPIPACAGPPAERKAPANNSFVLRSRRRDRWSGRWVILQLPLCVVLFLGNLFSLTCSV